MSESFAELFEESLQTVDMEPGSIVTGVVIDIDNEWVTVHAGLKSEGVIPLDQFTNANGECSLTVGDEVQVALETVEDGFGETKLSREPLRVSSPGICTPNSRGDVAPHCPMILRKLGPVQHLVEL